MPKRFYSLAAPITLILIWFFLVLQNYTPGTYLSGWDTLHPEFNFGEYFKRVFFGVWQPHQGLGAVASQAHASELPRLILYYLSSLILPKELLRYAYIFACLFIGPMGVYFFLRKIGTIPSFLASLFYLLNLITVQQFFVPFEMFATHYASLPWLFKFAIDYLGKQNPKTLLIFAGISLFSSSIAHTATLWYVYFLCFTVFLSVCFFVDRTKKVKIASLKLLLISLLVNSFWILPNLYFILNHAGEVGSSKIHSLFTGEAFAQNAAFGNILDLGLFKNFLFNWGVYTGNSKFEPLLKEWVSHLDSPFVTSLGFAFFFLIILGILKSLRIKSKVALPFLSLFFLGIFFWININPPTGFIFKFLQDHLPLFREAIRFPFTKFSIILLFAGTFFFAWGIVFLTELLRARMAKYLILAVISASLLFYSLPAFSGNLISPYMRTQIPNEYFELFNWFEERPAGRIASLPVNSFWGWNYYEFQGKPYQGAGFTWFGLPQPILEREFDRWQKYNEQYFREISQSVYTRSPKLLSQVLEKYNVSYILLDENIVSPSLDQKALYLDEVKVLLESLGLKKEKSFGKIIVYKTGSKPDIYTLNNAKSVAPNAEALYEDFAFEKYGHYISGLDSSATYFPFRSLMDNKNKYKDEKIKLTQEGIVLNFNDYSGQNVTVPAFEDLEDNFAVDLIVERNGNTLKVLFDPRFPKSNVPLQSLISVPQEEKNFLLSINQRNNFILNNLEQNTPLLLGTVFLKTNAQNSISLYLDRASVALSPNFENLDVNLRPCSATSGEFGINPSRNGFTLFGKGTSVCAQIPLDRILSGYPPDQKLLLGLSYTNKKNPETPCISDLSGSCLDYELKNIYRSILSSDKFSSYFEVRSQDLSNLSLQFFHIPEDSKMEESTYKNVQLSVNRPFFHTEFSKDTLSLSLDSLKSPNEKVFRIPFSGLEQFGLDIAKHTKGESECEQTPGLVETSRKQVLKQEFRDYIRYTGSFCDHFTYKNLSPNQGYLIIVQSRNVKGLPLRLCVTNPTTRRCDIYAHLDATSNFKNEIFLLPPTKESSFDINIHNFEIKNIPTVNDIASINIVPFPYNWLSRIESNPTQTLSSTRAITSKQINKSVYEANLTGGQENEILVLSQSYEEGWRAYQTGNSLFPFFSKELKEHVLVDGWANGWELNGYRGKVTIIFAPQYLEYLGFLILIVTFSYLLKQRKI